jgi:hypothetical protein
VLPNNTIYQVTYGLVHFKLLKQLIIGAVNYR